MKLDLKTLLERIKQKPNVELVNFIEKHPPYHFYRIRIREAEDLVREVACCIIVENEGTEDERAYFKDSRPIQEQTPSEIESLRDQIATQFGFIKVESFSINRAEEYALETGFVLNEDGTTSRKTVLAYFDEAGQLQTHELV